MLCAKHAAPMRATGSASPLLPGRVSSAVVRPRCFMRPGRLVVRSTLEPPTDPTGSARPPHITSAFTPGPGPSTPGGPTGSSVPPYTTGSTSSTGPRLGGGPGFPGTPTGGSGGGGGGSGGHGHSGAGGPPSGWSLGRIAWLLLGVTMTYTLGKILYNMVTGQTEADRTTGKLAADDVAVRGELAKEKGKNIVSSVKHATGHAVDKAVHKAEELAHDAHVAALKAEQRLERAKDKVEHSVSHAVDSTKHALALTSEEARHKAAEAGQDARYAKDQAKHSVKDTYKDAKYAAKDTAKDAKHAAELKAKDAKHAMDTAGREAEYGAKSAAKGTLETVKDAASSVGHALMWGGAKAESGTRRGINKLEKETGVYSAPTGTTRTADRRALYGTITGLAVGTSVLVGLWVWDRAGRPSGGDMAKKAKESGSEMAKKAQDAVGQAADTIKSAAAKTTGTTGVDPNTGTRVY